VFSACTAYALYGRRFCAAISSSPPPPPPPPPCGSRPIIHLLSNMDSTTEGDRCGCRLDVAEATRCVACRSKETPTTSPGGKEEPRVQAHAHLGVWTTLSRAMFVATAPRRPFCVVVCVVTGASLPGLCYASPCRSVRKEEGHLSETKCP
jgi:hypothetical protein